MHCLWIFIVYHYASFSIFCLDFFSLNYLLPFFFVFFFCNSLNFSFRLHVIFFGIKHWYYSGKQMLEQSIAYYNYKQWSVWPVCLSVCVFGMPVRSCHWHHIYMVIVYNLYANQWNNIFIYKLSVLYLSFFVFLSFRLSVIVSSFVFSIDLLDIN